MGRADIFIFRTFCKHSGPRLDITSRISKSDSGKLQFGVPMSVLVALLKPLPLADHMIDEDQTI
jgi:hypothetical protein